jgi:hypothetical protein
VTLREGDVILDSCAGSGTTGQAVLSLNERDEVNRKFVLIQLPHDSKNDVEADFNICEQVTAPRIQRVIEGYDYKNQRGKKIEIPGLGGSFTYARLGEPLFGEYRDLTGKPPAFEDLAKYVYYTETSRDCDPKKFKPKTGFIGEAPAAGGTSYYMLYHPAGQGREMSIDTLNDLLKTDKNRNWVIYCDKVWMHADDLRKFERQHNKRIRPMQVPYQLK